MYFKYRGVLADHEIGFSSEALGGPGVGRAATLHVIENGDEKHYGVEMAGSFFTFLEVFPVVETPESVVRAAFGIEVTK